MRADPDRRAGRVLRWYPRAWRERYGEEFAELLMAEMADRPRCRRRSMDVATSGLLARATYAGLRGTALGPAEQGTASLVAAGAALAAFLAFGLASWAQLTIGWRWARPATPVISVGMVVMTVTVAGFTLLLALAGGPVAWAALRELAGPRRRRVAAPAGLFALGGVLLVVGARHFQNGWPGTGGHHWAHQAMVPSGPAAFLWAATLSVSSYWAHPDALRAFPAAEVAWMAMSPIAIACLAAGAAGTLRRLSLSPRTLRYELALATIACGGMLAFLIGTSLWVIDGGPGPHDLFHAGLINVVGLGVMGTTFALASAAVLRGRRSRRPTTA